MHLVLLRLPLALLLLVLVSQQVVLKSVTRLHHLRWVVDYSVHLRLHVFYPAVAEFRLPTLVEFPRRRTAQEKYEESALFDKRTLDITAEGGINVFRSLSVEDWDLLSMIGTFKLGNSLLSLSASHLKSLIRRATNQPTGSVFIQ